jgi:hypothetical protein
LFLLDTCQDMLPIGGEEWEAVSQTHNEAYPNQGRDQLSLRRKFMEFVYSKKKTGDPHCPPHVLQAKRIMDAIIQRTDAGEGVPEDGLGFED